MKLVGHRKTMLMNIFTILSNCFDQSPVPVVEIELESRGGN